MSKKDETSAPAWHDEQDDVSVKVGPLTADRSAVPLWAEDAMKQNAEAAAEGRKRGRDDQDESLKAILARADPVLTSRHQRRKAQPPKPLSTLSGVGIKDVAWHPSGEVLVVTTANSVDTYHANGKYVARVASHRVKCKRLTQSTLVPSGEQAIVLPDEMYQPLLVDLPTGHVTTLTFMDSRIGAPHIAGAAQGRKVDPFPTGLTMKPRDSAQQSFALTLGATLALGSLSSGCITHKVSLPGDAQDVIYTGDNELAVAVGNKVVFYDVRKTGRFLRQFDDDGALQVTRLCKQGNVLAVGSASGVVNLYVGADTKPTKTMMNLSTAVDLLSAGRCGTGDALVMGASGQSNGFRFVDLTSMTVAASFPEVGMGHTFLQCMAFNPAYPVFSVGEGHRVVSYRC